MHAALWVKQDPSEGVVPLSVHHAVRLIIRDDIWQHKLWSIHRFLKRDRPSSRIAARSNTAMRPGLVRISIPGHSVCHGSASLGYRVCGGGRTQKIFTQVRVQTIH